MQSPPERRRRSSSLLKKEAAGQGQPSDSLALGPRYPRRQLQRRPDVRAPH